MDNRGTGTVAAAFLLLPLFCFNVVAAENEPDVSRFEVPLAFEPAAPDTSSEFVARAFGYQIGLDHGAVVLERNGGGQVRMALAGARAVSGQPEDLRAARIHHLRGREPRRWRTDLPTYSRVRYDDVLPGVDLIYYGNQRRLEYDVVVSPGRDPADVALRFEGATSLSIHRGWLIVETSGSVPLTFRPPRAYQDGAARREVEARYLLDGDAVRFALGPYDAQRELVIDPVIEWSSYVGGNGNDSISGMGISPSGEVVVVGTTAGAEQDVFVSRFSPQGVHLSTTTFGGTGGDVATGLDIDRFGNIYIVGTTNSGDFPTTSNAFQPLNPALTIGGLISEFFRSIFCDELCEPTPGEPGATGTFMRGEDAFVMKFSPSAQFALYSSYFGGAPSLSGIDLPGIRFPFMLIPGDDWGNDIAVDQSGRMHITGWTYSEFFPATNGSELTKLGGSFHNPDVFYARIDPGLSGAASLHFAGYLGGTIKDEGVAIAADGGGAYFTGLTHSLHGDFLGITRSFPTTANALHRDSLGGSSDAFLASAAAAPFSTFLGGPGDDSGRAIAAYGGNIYVGLNNQVMKIDDSGKPLLWTAHLGGDVNDVKIREFGSIPRLFAVWRVSNSEFAVVHLDIEGGLQTELARVVGGNSTSAAEVDADLRRIYVAGTTRSSNFPGAPGSALGGEDGFITVIPYNPFPTLTAVAATTNEGASATLSLMNVTGFTAFHLPYSATINWGDGASSNGTVSLSGQSGVISGNHIYRDNGIYSAEVCLKEQSDPAAVCRTTAVTVNNVAPEVTVLTAEIQPSTPGATYRGLSFTNNQVEITFNEAASFSDAGVNDTHSAKVVWSPGVETAVDVDQRSKKTSWATHVFTTAGDKTIQICIRDNDQAETCKPLTVRIPNANLIVDRQGPAASNECESRTFNITISNTGPSDAPNVVFVDEIPEAMREEMSYDAAPLFAASGSTANGFAAILQIPNTHIGEIVGDTAVVSSNLDVPWVFEFDRATLRWRATQQLPRVWPPFSRSDPRGSLDFDGRRIAFGIRHIFDDQKKSFATVYEKQEGVWNSVAVLTSPDHHGINCSGFGSAVSLGGEWLAVGADSRCTPSSLDHGSVYMYRRDGDSWAYHSKVLPVTTQTTRHIQFGQQVSLAPDGQTMYVQAGWDFQPNNDDNGFETGDIFGSIWVYRWNGSAWIFTQRIIHRRVGLETSNSFGFNLDTDGERLIATFGRTGVEGTSNERALIYRDDGNTVTLEAQLGPFPDPLFGGLSVAIDGELALLTTRGRTHVYSLANGNWVQVASLRPQEPALGADRYYGDFTATSAGRIVVGALDNVFSFEPCLQTQLGRIECNIGTLAAGQSLTFPISMKVGHGVAAGSNRLVSTRSQVNGGATDPDFALNQESFNTLISDTHNVCNDITGPVITPIVTGTLGDDGWYRSNATLTWEVADAESTIQSKNGCDASHVLTDTAGSTFTCTATSFGGTSTRSITLRRDATPPVVTVAPGGTMIDFSCQDNTSGIADCPPDTPIVPAAYVAGKARDRAGNESSIVASVPTANAGNAQELLADALCRARSTLAGSGFDPAGSPLMFRWFHSGSEVAQGATASFERGPGLYALELRVTNSQGFASSALTSVEVVDRTPPLLSNVPANVSGLVQQDAEGVEYVLPNPSATDNCGVSFVSNAPARFQVGTTPVTFSATDPSGNVTTAVTNVTVEARIELAMTVTTDEPAIAGREVRYRFKVSNSGPSDATGVVVRPVLPLPAIMANTGLDDPLNCTTDPSTGQQTCQPFLSPSPEAFCAAVQGVLTCTLGPIQANSERSFTMKVAIPSALRGEIVSSADTEGLETDQTAANDTASLTTLIGALTDRAVIFVPPAVVTAGSAADWTVGAHNLGPSDAHDVVTEITLPTGINFTGGPQNCGLVNGKVRCSFGMLGPGARADARVALNIDASHRGTITPVAMVTGVEPDLPNSGNDSAAVQMVVTAQAALSVTPSIVAPSTAGTDSVLTVDVRNGGPSTSTSTSLTLVPTEGITLRDSPGCTGSGSQLVCGLGTLGVAETKRQIVNISVDPYVRGQLGNGSASAQNAESQQPVVAAFSTNVNAQADLQLAFTTAPSRGTAGERITYQFNASNAGPSGGTSIEVTSTLLSPLAFHSGDGCTATGAMVRCAIDRLDPRATRALSFIATINPIERGEFNTSISGTGTEPDPVTPNTISNTTQIDVSLDLAATLNAAPSPVTAGTDLTYRLGLSNTGPSSAREVFGKLTPPTNGTIVPPADCTIQSGVVRCAAGSLGTGQSREFVLPVTIEGFTRNQVIGSASVESSDLGSDREPSNHSPSVTTPVVAKVDLQLTKDDVPDPVTAGMKLRYDLGVTNLGPSGATGVTLSDQLPAGVTLVPPPLPAPFTLARGANRNVSLEVTVGEFTRGIITNTAAVSSAEEETQPVDNNTTEPTSVIATSDLAVTMTDAPDPVPTGNILGYRVEGTNRGPSGSTDVRARVTLPSGVLFSSMSSSAGTCARSGAEVTCAIGNLASGGSFSVLVRVVPQTAGTLRASADVAGTEPDPNPANNNASVETKVSQSGGGGAAGDFDGDGDLDLAAVDEKKDQVVIFRNDGSGKFTEAQRVNVGKTPVSLAIADLNVDGKLDIAVANRGSDNVSILSGGPSGFAETSRPSVRGQRPSAISAGDLNGDGRSDLAVANEQSNDVSILMNQTFIIETELVALQLQGPNVPKAHGPAAITLGDLDRDGDVDLAVANEKSDTVSIVTNSLGHFAVSNVISLPGRKDDEGTHHPSAITVGDWNDDGWLDLAVANRVSNNVILLSNSGGSFTPMPEVQVGHHPAAITAGDLDADGRLDLATANRKNDDEVDDGSKKDSVTVLINGTAGWAANSRDGGKNPFAIVAGDFTGDGKIDLVTIDSAVKPVLIPTP